MERQTVPRRKRRAPLSRERVLRAAVALADAEGIEALSMRRLARELGVEAMSLYNHVANKDDLLTGITDLVMGEIERPDVADWKAALRLSAMSAHEVFARHPWACALSLTPERATATSIRRADWMLRRLREAGFSPELTYHAYHALDAHIVGFSLWHLAHGIVDERQMKELADLFLREFPREGYPYMHEHAEQHLTGFGKGEPGAFELVLDLILEGLERMRDAA
jgi:AcrR family transcriptional regulator